MGHGSTALEKLEMNEFWQGRRVLFTGHRRLKGIWLSFWLGLVGADAHSLVLEPETDPNLFEMLDLPSRMNHGLIADPCDPRLGSPEKSPVRWSNQGVQVRAKLV